MDTKTEKIDNIEVVSPILKQYGNDNDILKISVFFLTISIRYNMANINSINRLD